MASLPPSSNAPLRKPGVVEAANHNSPVPCAPVFATVVPQDGGDPITWTSSSTGAVILRSAESCDVIAKIENVSPSCIAVCGNKVWVGRENGMLNAYDFSGTFLTSLQNGSDNLPIRHITCIGDTVYTSASSKDVVAWDANKFCVSRILFGPIPGDLVQAIAHNGSTNPDTFCFFSGTCGHVRLWNADGKWTHCAEGGSKSLVYSPKQQHLWSATDRGIVIYATSHHTNPLTVIKTLCQERNILQLLFLETESSVWALSDSNEATVFDAATATPIQTLSTVAPLTGQNAFVSHKKEVTKVWAVSDEGHTIKVWDSVTYHSADTRGALAAAGAGAGEANQPSSSQQEVEHLKKKIRYIQSVGTIFRQRIGILFREKFRQRDYGAGSADVGDFEGMYRQALTDIAATLPEAAALAEHEILGGPDGLMPMVQETPGAGAQIEQLKSENESLQMALNQALSSNAQGSVAIGNDVEKVTKYWKDKLKVSQEDAVASKQEIERLSLMLHEMGPQKDIDIKRAHHICQVLKEKNALKEREMALQEEIESLKKQLGQAEEKYIELKNSLGDYVWTNMQHGGEDGASPMKGGGGGEDAPSARRTGVFDSVDPAAHHDQGASREKQYSIVVDQMREDSEKLKQELVEAQRQLMRHDDQANECQIIIKQNALLKNRIQKMKEQMQAARIDNTTSHTEMQHNIETLMNNINQLQSDLGVKETTVQELSSDKLKLMQDISRMNTILERYKTKVLTLEREAISRTKAQHVGEREHRRETQTLCESLDSREGKIQQLQANFIDISEQLQHQVTQVSGTNHELDLLSRENMSLKSKLQQLDILLDERRQFTSILGEVQGRMEMAIEELKRAQSTTELAAEMANLEHRIAGLTALEAQLKQKDDLIAVRDDEVQKLRLRLAMFERNVNTISAVFLQFPHSMEEMEMMIIENEEFRKMAGQNAELEERVKLRQLELQARRQQQQQQGFANSMKAGVTGSLEAATAALLAKTGDDSDSDDDGALLMPAHLYRTPGNMSAPNTSF